MATSREEVLANFQACTSIDDVAVCIMHLEECNWDLTQALNKVMSRESELHAFSQRVESSSPTPAVEDNIISPLVSGPDVSDFIPLGDVPRQSVISYGNNAKIFEIDEESMPQAAGPSQPKTRLLNFNIEFQDKIIPVVIPDSETVDDIKTVLFTELGIAQCQQELIGWRNCRRVSNHTRLSTLNLPKDNQLTLRCSEDCEMPVSVNGDDANAEDASNATYKLNIKDETNGKDYELNFLGSRTLLEVKRDLYSLTDISVRHQIWKGWPPGTTDKTTLALAGLDLPSHRLQLRKSPDASKNSNKKNVKNARKLINLSSSESSGEEFEDANESFTIEDDLFSHELSKKSSPLMPDNVEDDLVAAHSFTLEFINRYGETHPMFYQGSLEDALKEACFKPARERKQLLIYLHHDSSVLANVFCGQLLCSESIVSYISSNFITWAWDLTFESNKNRLLTMVMHHFGSVASSSVRSLNLEQLPLLLIINRIRSTNEVFSFIHGNVSLDELMTSLIHAVDVFSNQIAIESKEEDEREARESVKREQDNAYQASLLADQAKEQAKRAEEEEKLRIEQEKQEQQLQLEEASRHEEAIKEAIRQSIEQQLPTEPSENCRQPISRIRIRTPKGEAIVRRFLASDKLQTLFNFIASKGYPTEDYKVLSSWPRRDLTSLALNATLQELKLFPQETLTLEER